MLTFLAIARKQKFFSIDTRDEAVDYMEKDRAQLGLRRPSSRSLIRFVAQSPMHAHSIFAAAFLHATLPITQVGFSSCSRGGNGQALRRDKARFWPTLWPNTSG